MPGLVEFLAAVPDHRRAQGRRHTLVSILVLACDHERGQVLPIDLGREYDMKGLVDSLVMLAGVAV